MSFVGKQSKTGEISKETVQCRRLVQEAKEDSDFNGKLFWTKRLRGIDYKEQHFKQVLRKVLRREKMKDKRKESEKQFHPQEHKTKK